MKKGTRVGAIESLDSKEVRLYGYGVYDGNHKPNIPEVMGISAEDLPGEFKNPRIILDNGKIVWGCECWWGPEETIKDEIKGRRVVFVDPPEYSKTGGMKNEKHVFRGR